MYISYDAGEHWQSLKRNLPPVPVHDIALRDDDMVIATMGRAFYAMEGISLLRQADKVGATASATLFQPGTTFRSAGTVKAEYRLAKPDQVVTLELIDPRGIVLQKVSSADTATAGRAGGGGGGRGGFGGGAPVRVTNTLGMNSYDLSLRYPNGVDFRGAIYWGGNGLNGPTGAPGTYTVRMTAGSEPPQTQTVPVRKAAITRASEADIAEQVAFLLRIRDTVSAGNNAVRTVRNMRYQIDSARAKLTGTQLAAFNAAARSLVDSTRLVEEAIYQTRNQAGEDPLNFPIRLGNQIGALSGFVGSGERRPPQQAYDVWNTLVPQLRAQLLRLKRHMATLLPALNAALKAAGQPDLVPGTDELGAPPAGRAGRGAGGAHPAGRG